MLYLACVNKFCSEKKQLFLSECYVQSLVPTPSMCHKSKARQRMFGSTEIRGHNMCLRGEHSQQSEYGALSCEALSCFVWSISIILYRLKSACILWLLKTETLQTLFFGTNFALFRPVIFHISNLL